jgi:predicted ATPase
MGGVGKTSLAIEAAHRLGSNYTDGVYFIPLVSVAAEDRIAEVIGHTLKLPLRSEANLLAQLILQLRERHMLLVLDNAEHLTAGVAKFLAQLLQHAPAIRVIVTSRERLHLSSEWLIELTGLAYPLTDEEPVADSSAIQLFIQRARMVQPDFAPNLSDQQAIGRICRVLDGLPLAIELAAAWVRVLPYRSIATQITQGEALSIGENHSLPEHPHSLRATLNHSWQLLSIVEQEVLQRLAVFHNPFSLAAATSVAGASPAILLALRDKSLLAQRGDEHFGLHPLVYQYAAEQLKFGAAWAEANQQHMQFFAALCGSVTNQLTYQPTQPLEQVADDIFAAWEWAIASQEVATIEQMYRILATMLFLRGRCREIITLFGQAITAVEAVEPHAPYLLARLAVSQVWSYWVLGMGEQARQLITDNLAVIRNAGDQNEIGACLSYLGVVAWNDGSLREALDYAEQAAACYKATGNTISLLVEQSGMAMILHDLGDFDAAVQLARVTAETGRDFPHTANLGITSRLAYIEYARGNYAEAQSLLDQAQANLDHLTIGRISYLDCYRGLVLAAQGQPQPAIQLLQTALQEVSTAHWIFGMGLASNFLGHVLVQVGEQAEAHKLLSEGLAICEASGNRMGMAFAITCLAEATNDDSLAEQHLQRALAMAAQMEAAPLTCDGLVALASLRMRQQRTREASQLLTQAIDSPACRATTRERALRLMPEVSG